MCVIPGYIVEGILAKTVKNEPKEATTMNGLWAPLNMQVHYFSLLAHIDINQTYAFSNVLHAPNIILMHGETHDMVHLEHKLLSQFANQNIMVLSSKQGSEIHHT